MENNTVFINRWCHGGKSVMDLVLLPVKVHLDGMIDDEVSRANGIDLLWVTA